MFQASPTETRVYQSADSAIIQDSESDQIPVEFLNAINISGLPVSKMTLKVGCPVMLLRNLSTKDGLCNGTHAIVAILKRWVIGVHVIHGGVLDTEMTWIPHLSLEPSEDTEFHFTLSRQWIMLELILGCHPSHMGSSMLGVQEQPQGRVCSSFLPICWVQLM